MVDHLQQILNEENKQPKTNGQCNFEVLSFFPICIARILSQVS